MPYAIRRITEAGARIFFYLTDQELKRDTAVDRFQGSVMAFVDEMHCEQSRQRTRDALRRQAERGHVAGGMVYGYRNVEVRNGDKRSHVLREIVPDQADVVRCIFREIAAGAGFCRIAKTLNAAGVCSPRPQRHGWAVSGVREIVLRELYRGVVVYGKTRWEDHEGRKRKVATPASEWITVQAPNLRIVDDALWSAAHSRLDATRANYARLTDGKLVGRPAADRGTGYVLTGFLRCSACGGGVHCQKVTTKKGGPRFYYLCATQWTRGTCPGGGLKIQRESLEGAVLDAIETSLLTPERLAAVIERALRRQAAALKAQPDRRVALERQLAEAREKVDRYVRAIGDGLDLDEVKHQLSEWKAKAKRLEADLLGLTAPAVPSAFDRAAIARRVADWRGILRRGPVLARQILREILPGTRPLALVPVEGGVAFRAPVAWASVLAGLANLSIVVPPG